MPISLKHNMEVKCLLGFVNINSRMSSNPRPPVENILWLDLNFMPRWCVQQKHNYCDKNAIICCSISLLCIALPSSSQLHSLTMEHQSLVKRAANFLSTEVNLKLKQLATSFPHVHRLRLFISSYACCSCKHRTKNWCTELSLQHKNCKLWNWKKKKNIIQIDITCICG